MQWVKARDIRYGVDRYLNLSSAQTITRIDHTKYGKCTKVVMASNAPFIVKESPEYLLGRVLADKDNDGYGG
jgi:hypothetical protein